MGEKNILADVHKAISEIAETPGSDDKPSTAAADTMRRLTDLEFHIEYGGVEADEKTIMHGMLRSVRFAINDYIQANETRVSFAKRSLVQLNHAIAAAQEKALIREEEMRKRFRVVNDGPKHDPDIRQQVWGMTDGHCAYCDVKLVRGASHPLPPNNFEVEHVVPIAQGGPDSLANYVPACRSCNAQKHSGHVLTFIQRVRRNKISGAAE